ncbi:hypothetical protein A3D05_02885 [Candidatus Gottesmanbacteria bacterium RIFCSPHIGHO2_02_FULL_40_24]|uniref:L,D-TPase catalytic domain-containing protein n=1 Tax=Candidatus Gottesmanbacteria bacterium RIFCSPHIGHO2_01_FULL_40_15 TaxID=1798376 RepID=A0A1F5Z124_9BACT|nr:MAG: hypothetical protein A2777_00720 [Candidatus Gottesmanbacteria bacterium RIFCSPHIGHO2_01_FULL_40_15]OGG17452.1 MAG: hypothetical protein A3D05_02885 [Candidatus Gottesmanbacteria bacterium RIFCSPHIGHO2_02_FULL_40_24]OGG22140.1 MAG: hypothetical protein A3B48_01595 [Candidatus Gottesmanbacteria bacterium RIFCSPLOWO2_01_FULL_40_10]OGG25100.1 MAG: hypothetical protein A3E42_00845 [Candidatus Gottesmanbacteria bacterium RIFCSPHIGHO2_12_FULL_40_13]
MPNSYYFCYIINVVVKRFYIIFILFITVFFLLPSKTFSSEIITDRKLITVDLGKQMLFAWEGGRIIHQTRVSSGLTRTPTVKGSFSIRLKIPSQTMRGGSKYYGRYEYKNVPNVMYFYRDYAIHGAYWHNSFGRPKSHGCVNVPLDSAKWLFDWAEYGTRVEVF